MWWVINWIIFPSHLYHESCIQGVTYLYWINKIILLYYNEKCECFLLPKTVALICFPLNKTSSSLSDIMIKNGPKIIGHVTNQLFPQSMHGFIQGCCNEIFLRKKTKMHFEGGHFFLILKTFRLYLWEDGGKCSIFRRQIFDFCWAFSMIERDYSIAGFIIKKMLFESTDVAHDDDDDDG